MSDLAIPSVKCMEGAGGYGRFCAEPLEPGFGVTLGNAMRRVLLSSLPGAAVTWLLIEGVQHQFSCMPHVKEDVMEFLLNVKQLRLRPLSQQPGKLILDVNGEGTVCAADIKQTIDFEIANPELYLATLDSPEAQMHVEFNVELGRGYVPAGSTEGLPVDAIPVDAIFTPVHKANCSIEPITPGEEKSPERLLLEVWTDGSISPWEAVRQSADILGGQVSSFKGFEGPATGQAGLAAAAAIPVEEYNISLAELGLSTRAFNSLRRDGILTLGQLVERSRGGLPPLPGFGAKSQKEVEEMLERLGFPIVPGEEEGEAK